MLKVRHKNKVKKSPLFMQKHPSTSCFETTTKILTINNIEKAQNYQDIGGFNNGENNGQLQK